MNQLEQLKQMTTIVADTGEVEEIRKYIPQDATTNPTLIMKASGQPEYDYLIEDAVKYAKTKGSAEVAQEMFLLPKLFVNFGAEILKIIPGRVSTEVDAHLSFSVQGSIDQARFIISLYEEMGIPRDRVLIKLASTWEGIMAARALEKEGIHCNMTLLFSLVQAVACADAKATLISPFVGRILDWYKKSEGVEGYAPEEDPGVRSVATIYHYLKHHNHPILIMGASFRNKEEIIQLAGCDLLTISPQLLAELEKSKDPVVRKLDPEKAKLTPIEQIPIDEESFRYRLNDDAMATEKLGEGIRGFARDYTKLKQTIVKKYFS
ncbi:MAG: transaldolase [Waddliaceae bacterium]